MCTWMHPTLRSHTRKVFRVHLLNGTFRGEKKQTRSPKILENTNSSISVRKTPQMLYQNYHRSIRISTVFAILPRTTQWWIWTKKTAFYIGLTSYVHKVNIMRNRFCFGSENCQGHLCNVAVAHWLMVHQFPWFGWVTYHIPYIIIIIN